jgi:hypothetical protein
MIRSYRELRRLATFEERFDYLKLQGSVANATFGFDRYLNQQFYTSNQWKHLRHQVIIRDNGCDLGIAGYDIHFRPIIHHMNPMTPQDFIQGDESILNPEFLITTTHITHNAIHLGNKGLLPKPIKPRIAGDTKLW